MFFSALFLIAKVWNQPKHPLMDKWIKKTWCVYVYMYIMYVFVYVYARIIHNGIFLTHKKKKMKILLFVTMWMKQDIMLSEISHTQKNKYYMFSYVGSK